MKGETMLMCGVMMMLSFNSDEKTVLIGKVLSIDAIEKRIK